MFYKSFLNNNYEKNKRYLNNISYQNIKPPNPKLPNNIWILTIIISTIYLIRKK